MALLCLIAATATSCRRPHAAGASRALPAVEVPEAPTPIHIDGELDAREWARAAVTGDFRDGDRAAAPYSEARFLWRGTMLYIGLYAADEDIRSDRDFFTLEVATVAGPVALRVPPRGPVTPFVKGLLYAQDIDPDNTVDDDRDTDEEWTVELAVPLAQLAVAHGHARVSVRRCDTPKDQIERCGAWAAELVVPARP